MMGLFKFLFGETIDEFFRVNCPACLQKGLEGHADKCISQGFQQGTLVNPRYAWFQCIHCGSRFRRENAQDAVPIAVSDEEWNEQVEPDSRRG